jgi:hypothetical protein
MPDWRQRFKPAAALLLRPTGVVDSGAGHEHASFAAWCAATPGAACHLWLSLQHTQELWCDPQLPLRNDAAALAWARRVLVHYHGEAAQHWALAAWAMAGCRGVSALQGVDLQQLQSTAQAHGVTLRSVRPWWPQALAQALAAHAALRRAAQARVLVVEGVWVAVLALQRGRPVALHQRRLAAATPAALQALALEEAGEGQAQPVTAQQDPAAPSCVAIGWGLAPGSAAAVTMVNDLSGTQPLPQHLRSGWTDGLMTGLRAGLTVGRTVGRTAGVKAGLA